MLTASSMCPNLSIPVILLEVIPLSLTTRFHGSSPSLSVPMVHMYLKQLSLKQLLGLTRITRDGDCETGKRACKNDNVLVRQGNVFQINQDKRHIPNNPDKKDAAFIFTSKKNADRSCSLQKEEIPVVYLPSDNPTELDDYPCWVKAYVGFSKSIYFDQAISKNIIVDHRTLIRILPTERATCVQSCIKDHSTAKLVIEKLRLSYSFSNNLFGDLNIAKDWNKTMEQEILHNHDQETVNSLKLRMALLLSQPIMIGTSANALTRYSNRKLQCRQLHRALDTYHGHTVSKSLNMIKNAQDKFVSIPTLLWEEAGSLVVHSPIHGSGKTMLVQTIARRLLHCDLIHVVQAAPLLAKYGIHSDAALESMLHNIVIGAAVREASNVEDRGNCASVCIVLDQLDAMLPPSLSGKSSAGDAAVPVLNGIASYLNKVSTNLKKRKEFPFPSNKNQLYNLGGANGHVMSVRVCLVGVVTCPDDGGRSTRGASGSDAIKNSDATVLDALGGGHYRLPDPSAKTRFLAFQRAFKEAKIHLNNDAKSRLPILAASAVSARGNSFQRVAQRLTDIVAANSKEHFTNDVMVAGVEDLDTAMSILERGSSSMTSSANVSFMSSSLNSGKSSKHQNKALFASVGGNVHAKQALEDALALDPSKRHTMAKLGFSPPTGVLLYGPPGTGKTLLAKAIAKLLAQGKVSKGVGGVGGAFISLRASDVVQAQVGNSEKLLVNAFETARTNAPSVVFIDEFQALFTERTGSGSGRLTSTLLQCLDDVAHWRDADETATVTNENLDGVSNMDKWQQHKNTRVVVLGATNTPWMVDTAFLRPGRFDQVVHVGLPNDSERVDILNVHIPKMRLRYSGRDSVESLCETVALKCIGFSGADLVALCRAAAIRCLSEQGESGSVEEHHFLDALRNDVTCSSSSNLVQRLLEWNP